MRLGARLNPVRKQALVGLGTHILVFTEHAIDVLERAVGSLGVEQVYDGDEGEIEDGPDDVELPAEVLDAYGGDLDDYKRQGQ